MRLWGRRGVSNPWCRGWGLGFLFVSFCFWILMASWELQRRIRDIEVQFVGDADGVDLRCRGFPGGQTQPEGHLGFRGAAGCPVLRRCCDRILPRCAVRCPLLPGLQRQQFLLDCQSFELGILVDQYGSLAHGRRGDPGIDHRN